MQDLYTLIANLHRPRLLVSAAKHAAPEYRRERDLRRVLGPTMPQRRAAVVMALIQTEAQIEASRAAGDAAYNVHRHIVALGALMSEASQMLAERQAAA